MVTDPRTGVRSIRPARETFAAVALTGLTVGTVLRCVQGQSGGIAGAILTLIAVALLSRYRVSWDDEGITYRTPLSLRRRRWDECSLYTLEPEERAHFSIPGKSRPYSWLQPCRICVLGSRSPLVINLKPYSWQDIRHLTNRISQDLPLREPAAVPVS